MAEMVRMFGGRGDTPVALHRGTRILWLEPERGVVNEDVLAACRSMARDLGAVTGKESSHPEIFAGSAQAYAVLQSREAFAVHEPWIDSHAHEYDPNIRTLIDRGRRWSPSDLTAAAASRAAVTSAFTSTFAEWDLIVLPAVPTGAPTKAESTPDLRARILALTTPASLAVLPALTLPRPPAQRPHRRPPDPLPPGSHVLLAPAAGRSGNLTIHPPKHMQRGTGCVLQTFHDLAERQRIHIAGLRHYSDASILRLRTGGPARSGVLNKPRPGSPMIRMIGIQERDQHIDVQKADHQIPSDNLSSRTFLLVIRPPRPGNGRKPKNSESSSQAEAKS
jgi:hypothetical protein